MTTSFVVIDLAAGVANGIAYTVTEDKSNESKETTCVLDPIHKRGFRHWVVNLV